MGIFRFRKDIPVASSLYLLALSIFTVCSILEASCLDYIIPATILKLMYDAVLAVLLLKWVADERFDLRKLLVWIAALGFSGWLAYSFEYTKVFYTTVLVLSAEGTEFDDIIRTLLITMLLWTLLIVIMSLVGILDDYVFPHEAGLFGTQAHALGFKYYSTVGYNVMMLTLYYLYFDREFSWIRTGIVTVLNLGLYLVHTTGLSLLITIGLIAAHVVIRKFGMLKLRARIWDWVVTILPWGLFAATESLVLLYMNGKISADARLVSTLISRLKWSATAVERFGVHLFGTKVITYGNTSIYYGVSTTSFYIDSGFIYSLIAYGIVFTVLLLAMYSVLCRYVWRKADRFTFVTLIFFLCACVLNNFILSPVYNPALFLFPYALRYRGKRSKRFRQMLSRQRGKASDELALE